MASTNTKTIKVVVTGDSSSAQHALHKVGDEAHKSEGRFDSLASKIANWSSKGVLALGAVAGAAGVMGVKTASEMEQSQFAFTNMLGSGEKAQKFLDKLKDFAAHTPFDFPELAKSSQMLIAMGINAKDVIPTMTAVGDAVAGMGGSQEQIEFVARALGQMQAKGKVAGDELLQLTEQGIPALQILAGSYGVSTQKMSKMVEKGQVLSSKAIPLLVKGLEQGTKHTQSFGGMMAKQAVSAQGRWSTMMDTIHEGLGNLAAKALPTLEKAMIGVTDGAENLFAGLQGKGPIDGFKGKLDTLGLGIRAFFISLKDGDVTSDGFVGKMETLGAGIWGLINAFKTGKIDSDGFIGVMEKLGIVLSKVWGWISTTGLSIFKKLVGAIREGIGVVVDIVGWFNKHRFAALNLGLAIAGLTALVKIHAAVMKIQALGGLIAYIKQIGIVQKVTKVWTAVQWLLNAALDANPIAIVVLALTALVVGFVLAYEHSEKFRKIVAAAWEWIKKAASATWSFLKTTFAQMKEQLGIIGHNAGVLKDQFVSMWGGIKHAFQTGVSWVINRFLDMVGLLLKGAAKAFGWVPGIGGKLKGASKAFDKFKRDVNASLGGINSRSVNVGVTFKAGSKLAYDARHQGLAGGGKVQGPGTSTSDSIPAYLSNDEHVLTAADVRAAGGHEAIYRWRRALHRATGGPVIVPHLPSRSSINRESISGILAAAKALGPSLLGNMGGSGIMRWAGIVLQVLAMLGQPSGAVGSILRRIKFESGGNPGAINLWDSNARAGHPSQGLMQVIAGTFNAFAGPFRGLGILNPLANVFAGVNYAVHRYGSAYAIDPLVRPTGYDRGGLLPPGLNLTYNGTRKPEAVFTGDQLSALGGVHIDKLVVQGNVLTEKDLIKAITVGLRDELLKHAGRNGGRTGLPGK